MLHANDNSIYKMIIHYRYITMLMYNRRAFGWAGGRRNAIYVHFLQNKITKAKLFKTIKVITVRIKRLLKK